jgi:hypothetical protein
MQAHEFEIARIGPRDDLKLEDLFIARRSLHDLERAE